MNTSLMIFFSMLSYAFAMGVAFFLFCDNNTKIKKVFMVFAIISACLFSTYNFYKIYTGEAYIDECKQWAKDYYITTSYQKEIGCVMETDNDKWEKFSKWGAERQREAYLLEKHKKDFIENEYNAYKDRVNETNLFGE